jgi:DNA-binding IclR family transcriptional regulator
MGLSIYDFRDTDLMVKIAEEQGAEGVDAHALADALGMGKSGVQSVGIRLAWMKRFGMVAYDDKQHLWRLTDGAGRVIESHARAAAIRQIEEVPDESIVEVMSHVTARYRLGDPMVASLLRREFQYGTSPRSRVWNGR